MEGKGLSEGTGGVDWGSTGPFQRGRGRSQAFLERERGVFREGDSDPLIGSICKAMYN